MERNKLWKLQEWTQPSGKGPEIGSQVQYALTHCFNQMIQGGPPLPLLHLEPGARTAWHTPSFRPNTDRYIWLWLGAAGRR
jgi:hypothetical protein